MKLIVGLGNPGEKYAKTRHNVGFMVLDALASQISKKIQNPKFKNNKKLQSLISNHQSLILAKPQTFMNSSGTAVKKLVVHFKISPPNLRVIHDDLDLRLGTYKIQKGKGPREHKGLLSIYEKIGTRNFWHIRVGVDNREKMENGKWKTENRVSGEDYVLQKFLGEELKIIDDVIDKIIQDLVRALSN